MFREILHSIRKLLARPFTQGEWRLSLSGLLSGLYVTCLLHHFVANFGLSQSGLTAIAITVTGTVAVASILLTKLTTSEARRFERWGFAVSHAVLAIWAIAIVWIEVPIWSILSRFSWAALQSPATMLAVAVIHLGLPLLVVCLLSTAARIRIDAQTNSGQSKESAKSTFGIWLATGITFGVLFAAPGIGVEFTRLLTAVVGIVVLFHEVLWRPVWLPLSNTQSCQPTKASSDTQQGSLETLGVQAFLLLLTGMAFGFVDRIVEQFVAASFWVYGILLACFCLGSAIGRFKKSNQTKLWWQGTAWCLATWCIVVVSGFELLLRSSLYLNAYVSSPAILVVGRGILVAVLAVPLGICLRRSLLPSSDQTLTAIPWANVVLFGCTLLGGLVTRWLLLPTVGVAWSLTVAAWSLVTLVVIARARAGWPSARKARLTFVVATLAVVVSPLVTDGYQPQRAAKALFDTNAFAAFRAGNETWKLPFYDEGRVIQTVEGTRGTYTLWRFRGSQLQIRESGIPKSLLSVNSEIAPQYSAEITHAVLPIALHRQPRRVMVLGASGGVQLATCLQSPIAEIVCVESDPALINICKQTLQRQTQWSALRSDNVEFVELEPVLAVASNERQFDVIVDSPEHSASIHAAPSFTRQYYQHIANRLDDEGLYCQRFAFVDVGASTMAAIMATLSTTFSQVAAIETAPGTTLFLASNSTRSFHRPELMSRLQSDHVRRILASAGWDWSTLLNLPTCESQHWATAVERMAPKINTVANGRLAFKMPLDVMRWAPKREEVHQMLANNSTRLLMWTGDVGTNEYIQNRMGELRSKQRIVTVYPDEYWRYRSSIKDQLKKRPKAVIKQASNDPMKRKRHPEDQYRMEYLQTLGKAVKNRKPTMDELTAVAGFQEPFDPLISYFLHGELAEIAMRTRPRPITFELTHRLHKIYFSSASDRSVRNIVAALKMLAEHPEAIEDQAERFDHMNALLQMMQIRWNNRRSVSPSSSQIALHDIEQSISAVEAALESMAEIREKAELSERDWQARSAIIEKYLLRPLRTLRGKILPQYLKRSGKKKASTLYERNDYSLPE